MNCRILDSLPSQAIQLCQTASTKLSQLNGRIQKVSRCCLGCVRACFSRVQGYASYVKRAFSYRFYGARTWEANGQRIRTLLKEGRDVGDEFICPVGLETISFPVTTPCGHSFEEAALKAFVKTKNFSCPCCRARISRFLPAGTPDIVYQQKTIAALERA